MSSLRDLRKPISEMSDEELRSIIGKSRNERIKPKKKRGRKSRVRNQKSSKSKAKTKAKAPDLDNLTEEQMLAILKKQGIDPDQL